MRAAAVFVVLLCVGSALAAPADLLRLPCLPSSPIRITEDVGSDGFVLAMVGGAPVYRPGSGVTTGNGTVSDPFIIEGLCITASAIEPEDPGPAVEIRGTTLHVLVRSIDVEKADTPIVQIRDAANVSLAGFTESTEFWVISSSSVRIEDSEGETVKAISSRSVLLAGLSLRTRNQHVVEIADSEVITVTQSTLSRGWNAVMATKVAGLVIANNSAPDPGWGIRVRGSPGAVIDGNFVHSTQPLDVAESDGSRMTNNTLEGGGDIGLAVAGGGMTVAGNLVSQAPTCIEVTGVGNVLSMNTATGCPVGILLKDARNNLLDGNVVLGGNLSIIGADDQAWVHTIPPTNMVEGHPVRYFRGVVGLHLTGVEDPVIVVGGDGVSLDGHRLVGGRLQSSIVYSRDVVIASPELVDAKLELRGNTGVQLTDGGFVRSEFVNAGGSGTRVERSEWVDSTATFTGSASPTVTEAMLQGSRMAFHFSSTPRLEWSRGWASYVDFMASTSPAAEHNDLQNHTCTSIQLRVYGSPDASVRYNNITGCGMQVGAQSMRANISYNAFRGDGSRTAVRMVQGALGNEGTTVYSNIIRDWEVGVRGTALTRAVANNFEGNTLYGVTTEGTMKALDAENNWWGCAAGPGQAGCDAAGAKVLVNPWLAAPDPHAGP